MFLHIAWASFEAAPPAPTTSRPHHQPPLPLGALLALAVLVPDQCPGLQFACTVIAILLHFLYLCAFSWALLEALHLYRALTEVRDVNASPMRFYYMLGWGVPAFITGILPPFLAWRFPVPRPCVHLRAMHPKPQVLRVPFPLYLDNLVLGVRSWTPSWRTEWTDDCSLSTPGSGDL